MSSRLSSISELSGAAFSTSEPLVLAGWMSGNLVLGGGVVGVDAYSRLGA